MPTPAPQPPSPTPVTARRARAVARWVGDPIARFLQIETASGLLILGAAGLALVWANSPWSAAYEGLWGHPLTLSIGSAATARTLRFWVNEGLMSVFFLVAGLEIRRELHQGALSSAQRATLPAVAALGGMIAPALIFLALDHAPLVRRGWAVPTPTDIAFAVGVLALLGSRVPRALRVLLLALAIIDDIGAVVIIALFYSRGLSAAGLISAGAATIVALALARRGGRWLFLCAAGVVIWIGLLRGGVHPTLAGVILGLLVPITASSAATPEAVSPATRLANVLHPWVAFGVMPLFALANAGIDFRDVALQGSGQAMLVIGIAVSLVLGKPLGIVLAALACLKLRLCALPPGVTLKGVLLVGCLGGIGFTMSIFIAGLAFGDAGLLPAAKLGVLVGSASAALVGITMSRLLHHRGSQPRGPARQVEAANGPESSRTLSPRS